MSCVHVFVCMGVTCVQGRPTSQVESSVRFDVVGRLRQSAFLCPRDGSGPE